MKIEEIRLSDKVMIQAKKPAKPVERLIFHLNNGEKVTGKPRLTPISEGMSERKIEKFREEYEIDPHNSYIVDGLDPADLGMVNDAIFEPWWTLRGMMQRFLRWYKNRVFVMKLREKPSVHYAGVYSYDGKKKIWVPENG